MVEQSLLLFKQLVIRLVGALRFYVKTHGIFWVASTYSADEIAFGPELSAPELFFDFGELLEDCASGDAFDYLYDPLGQHCGDWLDQKMHVVIVSPDLKKMYLKSLSYLKARLLQ